MPDTNITDPQISNASNLLQGHAELVAPVLPSTSAVTGEEVPRHYLSPEYGRENSSISADIKARNAPDLSSDVAKAISLIPAARDKESRKAPRFRVKWRIEIHIDEQGMFTGFVKDVSTTGASIYLGRNLQAVKFVTLHICITPFDTTSKPRIVVVFVKIVYTVYDSEEHLFRAGVTFLKFNSESDLAFLEARLTNHHVEIDEHRMT